MTPEPDVKLVKVFESANPALTPIVESVLRDSGIDFVTQGEALQGTYGWGRFGMSSSHVLDGIGFFVREEDEAEARAVLAPLSE